MFSTTKYIYLFRSLSVSRWHLFSSSAFAILFHRFYLPGWVIYHFPCSERVDENGVHGVFALCGCCACTCRVCVCACACEERLWHLWIGLYHFWIWLDGTRTQRKRERAIEKVYTFIYKLSFKSKIDRKFVAREYPKNSAERGPSEAIKLYQNIAGSPRSNCFRTLWHQINSRRQTMAVPGHNGLRHPPTQWNKVIRRDTRKNLCVDHIENSLLIL